MEYFGVSNRLFDHFVLVSFRSYGGILTLRHSPITGRESDQEVPAMRVNSSTCLLSA